MEFREKFMEECKNFLSKFEGVKDYISLSSIITALCGSVILWAVWPMFCRIFAPDWVEKKLIPEKITLAQSIAMTITSYVSAAVATKVIK